LLSACTTQPTTTPTLVADPGPWFIGETNIAHVEWPAETSCSNNGWDCTTNQTPAFQLTSVTCSGCTTNATLGQTSENAATFTFAATTTDAIALDVVVESGGDRWDLGIAGVGDRELGLVATCAVLPTDQIESSEPGRSSHPCGATRRSWESVLVGLQIETLRGDSRFPFCPDPGSCSPVYPRKTSQIAISPKPDRTIGSMLFYSEPQALDVAVSAPLATGELATASVATPPVGP
jgi:hypothetical protein